MSIYKRYSKKHPKKYTWWISITLPNGKRIRISAKTSDREKAQRLHDKLKDESWDLANLDIKPEYLWEDATNEYLNEKRYVASPDYLKSNINFLNKYLTGIPLKAIDDRLVKHITNERAISTYTRKENGTEYNVTINTVNHTLIVLKAVLNLAKDELKWIDKLPKIKKLKQARSKKNRTIWLTKAEVKILIDELPEHLKGPIRFSLATGLRHKNVTHLEWSEISFKNRTAWFYADEVKNEVDFSIPLNDEALAILLEEKGKHPVRVFTYQERPINNANTKAWRKALDRAGIAPYTPGDSIKDSDIYPTRDLDKYKYSQFRYHDLRHTWASWHVQNGTPLIILQELGGWKTFDMVLKYAHLGKKHTEAFANNSIKPSFDEDE